MPSKKPEVHAPAVAVALVVQTTLFALFWRFMNRLSDKGCACALTPRFANVRSLFKTVVVLYYVTIWCLVASRYCPPAVFALVSTASWLLGVVLSVYVVRWWLEMRRAGCACTESWEKDLWAFLSAYEVASIVCGLLGAAVTILSGR